MKEREKEIRVKIREEVYDGLRAVYDALELESPGGGRLSWGDFVSDVFKIGVIGYQSRLIQETTERLEKREREGQGRKERGSPLGDRI